MKYIIVSIVLVVSIALFLANSTNGAAIGNDNQNVVKSLNVNVTESPEVNEDCHQPKLTGRCYALFNRYAFDVEKGTCEEFIYGGCGGNENNFETKEDCEKKCLRNKSENTEPEGGNSSTTSTTTEVNSHTKDTEEK